MAIVAKVAAAFGRIRTPKNDLNQNPSIEVKIDGHFKSRVYTSGSTISGQAIVRTWKDTHFDDFQIIFCGIVTTRLYLVQRYTSHSYRPFMKLSIPVDRSALPESNIFEANRIYTIPFKVAVPHHLTDGVCNHHCSPAVKEHHNRLLPSLGFWEWDDQAPEGAQIEYSIKARAYKMANEASKTLHKTMEGCHMLNVLPHLPEDAPLDITLSDECYDVYKSKTIRKTIFSVNTGKLTATAAQPGAVTLSADGRQASGSSAQINLVFTTPSPGDAPPKLNSVSGRIITSTFVGTVPTDFFPNLGSRATRTAHPMLSYIVSNKIFMNNIAENLTWHMCNVSEDQGAGYSNLENADEGMTETDRFEGIPMKSKMCLIRHNAIIHIPLNLPMSRKMFLPTFHSCFISRTYMLRLKLSVGSTNRAMSLAIPLQICVEKAA